MLAVLLLIKIMPTFEREILKTLKDLDEVIDCHVVFGDYDIIAAVRVENFANLQEFIGRQLELIPGVMDIKINVVTYTDVGG